MLKKNIILISVFFIVLSCENDYQYVKVEVDGKNGKIKILSNDYVIDSINIGNYKIYYYNAVLLKKNEGKNSMLVLNNIRCKLISRVFAVVNRETPYINTYKFAS